jgi:hypothetical protein
MGAHGDSGCRGDRPSNGLSRAASKTADLAEAGVEETLTYYAPRRNTGGVSEPTTRSSASCARSGGARGWSVHPGWAIGP